MRRVWAAWLVLSLLGGAASPWIRDAAAQPKRITVGLSLDSPFMLPFYLADERTAREEGLDLEVVSLGGGPRVAAAVASGSIDVGVIALSTLVNLVLAGQPVKGFYAVNARAAYEWFGREPVRAWGDLRGKSVGVTTLGSATELLTRHVLRRHGLEPGRDVTLLAVGEQRTALAAVRTGRVDAAILTAPATWIAAGEGFTRLGTQADEIGPVWPRVILAAREEFLTRDEKVVHALLRAVVRGIRLARADRGAAVDLMVGRLKYERPVAERGYQEVVAATDERGALPTHGLPLFWSILAGAGEVPGPMPEARFFDPRFVDTFDAWAPR
jgi:NitT/TauT family transport system substrate-binding protein